MKCLKCKSVFDDSYHYCPICGAKVSNRRPRSRANGEGSVFRRGKSWMICYIAGWDDDGKRICRYKGGFATKREALEYLPTLKNAQEKDEATLAGVYEKWLPTHQASKSTINCYKSAWKYLSPISDMRFADVDVDDLQECIDECPKGKQVRRNMKTLAGLLYKYAIPRHLTDLNLGEYLTVTGPDSDGGVGIPLDDLERLWAAVGRVPYADYVLCHCYLGFRPSELLALKVEDYDTTWSCFTGGSKTEAGKNRIVPVSPKIKAMVESLIRSGPYVFSLPDGSRMPIKFYRERFYEVLEDLGVDNPVENGRHLYTPHSCRHTFATLLKNVQAPGKDKLEIIGHTSEEMLRYYQDVSIEDLRKIADKI